MFLVKELGAMDTDGDATSSSTDDKLLYLYKKLSIRFSLVYCKLLAPTPRNEKAEQLYARAMNDLLELLHADPERPDDCFVLFRKALLEWHIGYHMIKGQIFGYIPCTATIGKYQKKNITIDRSAACNVLSLVPFRMSKF